MDAGGLVEESQYVEKLEEPIVELPLLISAGYDQCIKFWDVARSEARENFIHKESQINMMRISSDGMFLAIAGWQHARVYNLNVNVSPPSLACSCEGVVKNVTTIGFDERSNWIFTAGEDCSVRIWDFRSSLQCRKIFQTLQVNSSVNCIVIHPNQTTLIISDVSGSLYFWDVRNKSSDMYSKLGLEIFEHVTYIDISKTAELLVGVTNKGKLILWSVVSNSDLNGTTTTGFGLKQKAKVVAHSKYALRCHFSPNYKVIATTGADGYVYLWDVTNITTPVKSLYIVSDPMNSTPDKMESQWVWDCAFTLDSKYLFTASGCQLKLWNLETDELVRQYQSHNKMISCFAFRDGQYS
ncbi:unnamed protein product [Thelazia callipaeda]|uniref:Target of rapamycin complex subunit lst8 n=1 Tax=Thelazia callipaeda TaxID=103827 RepID=A0A0N5D8H9_THECL|nr:unnamed protein product [Thelazia callipaeda]